LGICLSLCSLTCNDTIYGAREMDLIILNLLNGISYGMILFLIASGMSIVMGMMGITNLAHGALYMVGAYVGWTIAVHYSLNFGLAVFLGGLAGGFTGLIIERAFLRRLYKQPNEQVLLTFGLVFIITNICIWIWTGRARLAFSASSLSGPIDIAGMTYPLARIAIIFVGLIVALALWWLQDKTRVGAMVRAGMDDKQMTMGLGINLAGISTVVFFLASFMAGAAGVIGAQLLGVYNGLGLDILLLALIVVIVGGMGSVQGALLGAILIGVIDAFGKALFPQFSMFTMYMAMVIILMVKPSGLLGRRTDQSIPVAAEVKPTAQIPVLDHLDQKFIRFVPYYILAIVLICLPPFLPSYIQGMMIKFLVFAIFAMSFNLVFGYTGLLSLGHAAYFGAGGYAVALLMFHYGINSFWIGTLAAIILALLTAAVFGLIALRVSGLYFMLITFALGQLLYSVAWNWKWLNSPGMKGITGLSLPSLGIEGFSWNPTYFYYFVFLVFVICFFLLYRIANSPFGLALVGIRESEPRMRALGYNTWLYKYIVFLVGGIFAGIAGMLYVYHNRLISPLQLGVATSFLPMCMAIIGGRGTIFGPIIGAALIVFVEYFASIFLPQRWPLILGGLFVLVIMFAKEGVGVYLWRFYIGVIHRYGSIKG